MSEMKLGKHKVEISHPDKVLFPKENLTKLDLAEYYKKISKYILPHVKDRPITMNRYPNGIEKKNFFQKDSSDFFPSWIKTKKIKKKEGGNYNAVICNDTATLVYLANLASITPHIWLSKKDSLDKPNKIIFDLDPPKNDFADVKFAAKKIRDYFEDNFDITPFLMTTGSKGLHVVIPIKPEYSFEKVRNKIQNIAEEIAEKNPDKLTTAPRKAKRKGRVYLDVARNAYGQTAVAPYSVRAKEKAPVAVPIEWDELSRIDNARKYNMKNIFRRLSSKDDPWKNFNKKRISFHKIDN